MREPGFADAYYRPRSRSPLPYGRGAPPPPPTRSRYDDDYYRDYYRERERDRERAPPPPGYRGRDDYYKSSPNGGAASGRDRDYGSRSPPPGAHSGSPQPAAYERSRYSPVRRRYTPTTKEQLFSNSHIKVRYKH